MMYLNGQKGFIKDFFERTAKIIKSFEKINNDGCEVTLLCNCMLGIFIFPEQKFYNEITNDSLSDANFKKLKQGLLGQKKPRSIKKIFSRMRNAIAHCNIRFECAENKKNDNRIKYIYFYDDENYSDKKKLESYEFQLRIDIADLKDILFDFCDKILANEVYEV